MSEPIQQTTGDAAGDATVFATNGAAQVNDLFLRGLLRRNGTRIERAWEDEALLGELRLRAQRLGPLLPGEMEKHRTQCELVMETAGRVRNHVLQDWDLGWALLVAFLSGYWLRDPEHRDKSFLQFAVWLAREAFDTTRSPQTLERRMHLAAAFTREEAASWARRGVGSTVLSYIGSVDERLRDKLFSVAEGHPSQVVMDIGKKGMEQLARAEATDAAGSALAAMDGEMRRIEKKGAEKRRNGQRRAPTPPAPPAPQAPPGPGEVQGPGLQAGEGGTLQGGDDLASSGAWRLAELGVKLEEQEEQLKKESARLEAEKARIDGEQAQLAAQKAGLGEREAALRTEQAALEAGRSQSAEEAAALAAQKKEFAAREAQLSLREQAVQAREEARGGDLSADLERRLRETLAKEAEVLAAQETLRAEQAAVAAQRQHNEALGAELTTRETALREQERRAAEMTREAEMLRAAAEVQKEGAAEIGKDLERRAAAMAPREQAVAEREQKVEAREADLVARETAAQKLDAHGKALVVAVTEEQVRLRKVSAELSDRAEKMDCGIITYENEPEDMTTTLMQASSLSQRIRELFVEILVEQAENGRQIDRVKLPRRIMEVFHEVKVMTAHIQPWVRTVLMEAGHYQPDAVLKATEWLMAQEAKDQKALQAECAKAEKETKRLEARWTGEEVSEDDEGKEDDEDEEDDDE